MTCGSTSCGRFSWVTLAICLVSIASWSGASRARCDEADDSQATAVADAEEAAAGEGGDAKQDDATKDGEPKSDEPATKEPTKKDAEPEAKQTENKTDSKAGDAKAEEASRSTVERLVLSGSYADLVGPTELDPVSLLMGDGTARRKSFYKLCDQIDELAKNEKVSHIVFDLSSGSLDLNLAQLDELLRRIARLKQAGKKLAAWLESPSATHLAIAAGCDHVAMSDFGGIDMPSKSMQSIFYRDAMDLLGVKASVVRAGNFKGAVEPYLNSAMSEHLRDHYREMLATMNDAEVSMIAKGRGLTTEKVRELQKQRFLLPTEGLAAGLVDELAPTGSLKTTLGRWAGDSADWVEKGGKARKEMSLFELMGKMMSSGSSSTSRVRKPSVAVLHLSGTIIDGSASSGGSIVSGPTVKAIRELADDEKVKAVVVRINSPGGSATASEAIRQALLELEKRKPVVVSMGEMAASGGYWVSCIGVPVYAERGTITGSIGVFSMKISFGSLMKRVGLHVENIALDEAANAFATDRGWNEEDQEKLQKTIDDVYTRFLSLVSSSRGIDVEKLHDLAGGRVWSGTQAKQNGLVDEIGGLDDCLAVVSKKAGLDEYDVVHRPQVSSGLDLSALLGDGDTEELRAIGISTEALQLLARRGLSLSVLKTLLSDGINTLQRPTVWAIGPADVSIR
jgi:protease-4